MTGLGPYGSPAKVAKCPRKYACEVRDAQRRRRLQQHLSADAAADAPSVEGLSTGDARRTADEVGAAVDADPAGAGVGTPNVWVHDQIIVPPPAATEVIV